MAPKRSMRKREAKCSGGMTLRSGTVQGRQVTLEDGSSRILPMSPPKKSVKRRNQCVYVDDEAWSLDRSIDGDSNSTAITPNTVGPSFAPTPQTTHTKNNNQDEEDDFSKHDRVFWGECVSRVDE
ncbi:hypothetical protein GOP47_0010278 [Adiantum capillus-veneris]|uniref:Uncharacterized protein n=1 Tax=Adiantum capillus-veneris TaxID=13818 RepID=A0A9D4ZHL9_ADICA|nr:hypothetical protein GOP47_0010278 [Adiantum capillus-veneris]